MIVVTTGLVIRTGLFIAGFIIWLNIVSWQKKTNKHDNDDDIIVTGK